MLATGAGINSAARSHAKQRELWDCRQHKLATGGCNCPDGCNPANPPGSSWHEYDEAATFPNPDSDASSLIGGAYALAVDFAEPYPHGANGLCWPIAGEPWHAQPAEITESARVAGAWRRLPSPPSADDGFDENARATLNHFVSVIGD